MYCLVGLGNPGDKYKNNRHNIGYMAIDEIQQVHHFPLWQKKNQMLLCQKTIEFSNQGENYHEKILLVKPQTFMNLSGQAVREVLKFYSIPLEKLFVLHDDLEVKPKIIRLKKGGGAGGHNGLRSIDAHCGKEYHRIRLGIGRPPENVPVCDFVLNDFYKTDYEWLSPLLRDIANNIFSLLIEKNNI